MFKIPINQQINTYLRQQQALARQMADIKKQTLPAKIESLLLQNH